MSIAIIVGLAALAEGAAQAARVCAAKAQDTAKHRAFKHQQRQQRRRRSRREFI